ncbi:superoxide dismutase [Candidatus Uhrbacteria bacterium]|nr:superoxide dismutase [Candidatus Uhrbacteria bacterium]
MAHTLPKLPYAYDALEPFIDARTMEIHHTKHHQVYVDKLNAALETVPTLKDKPVEELLRDLSAVPESIRTAVRNHGGGHANHSLFWTLMNPRANGEGGKPSGALADALTTTFGGLEKFQEEFSKAAVGVFGSGWAWLTLKEGKLAVITTPNQDSPISTGATPLLALDVWEHAYYLKYQQKRADYVAAWWNVVNWDAAAENFSKAK